MKNFRAIIGVIGIIAGIGFSGTAHAEECANYPTVAWLGNLTHEKVALYAGTRLEGDWNAYTEKWDRQRANVNHCFASEVAEFESFGVMTDKG